MKQYIGALLGWLIVLGLSGCMRESEDLEHRAIEQTPQEFEVLSVTSHQSGMPIQLSMDLEQQGEDLRSVAVSEYGDTGALDRATLGGTEEMHLYLYKEGDPASLSVATVVWQGRSDTQIKLDNISFSLAPGYSLAPGDSWIVSGILGGKLDPATKTVKMDTRPSATEDGIIPRGGVIDAPYILAWQSLEITGPNSAVISRTSLKPVGSLMRLQFYSNVIEDYTAQRLRLTSNAIRPIGSFDPAADTNIGAHPVWTAETADGDVPHSWTYQIDSRNPLYIPAGQGYAAERTLYLWGMPTSVASERSSTSVEINVAPSSKSGAGTWQTTYHKEGHRGLKSGHSYRLSNVLSSDLMITEVFYQFVWMRQDPDHSMRKNYSIVELYNPTVNDINLADYALARTVYSDRAGSRYYYANMGNTAEAPMLDPQRALMLPLSSVTGSGAGQEVGFSTLLGGFGGAWYRKVLGTPSITIKPGQTILLGADGYIGGNAHSPGKNIALFNDALQANPNIADDPTAIRQIEKHYYSRAGMQIDSAVHAGYAQFMVAIDNGHGKKNAPGYNTAAGVLLMDNGDGFALFKRRYTAEAGTRAELIDITTPLGDSEASRTHRSKIIAEYNQASSTPINSIVTGAQIAYSTVRHRAWSFPTRVYDADDWRITISENDGIKSLGTRHYIAGLTPFERNYTGYKASNNPLSLPFWSGITPYTAPAAKTWGGDLPMTGQNVINTSVGSVQGYLPATVSHATSSRPGSIGQGIEKSYDGDLSTGFVAARRTDAAGWPVELTYTFAQPERLDHIRYAPHGRNGSIAKVDIHVTYEDGSTALALAAQLEDTADEKVLRWADIGARRITSVRFVVYHGYYKMVSVREMQFMKRAVDVSHIFNDEICSQLRPGVAYADIQAMSDPVYREIARQMYQGTYPREFRIAEYQSYPDPDVQCNLNRTQFPYSLFDNPTGIAVQKGERLVVLVDNPAGHRAALAVQDYAATPSSNDNFTRHPLQHGINIITTDRTGLVYLLYHSRATDRGSLPSIRLHIIGGKVNGYYDSTKPNHRGRWRELLSRATAPYFDVLSEHVHLTYEVNQFRHRVTDIDADLSVYELFLRSQWELMGLVKYNRTFNNRMQVRVVYPPGFLMYAYYNRIAFGNASMPNLIGAANIRQNPWGLAHEMGHVNQTIGLNWGGMVEVTVNIFASYIQFAVLGQEFRGLRDKDDWFTTAWNALLGTTTTLSAESRANNSLIPMIQLELYLGQVLGKTPMRMPDKGGFYPELFQLLRVANANKNNTLRSAEFNGDQQAELAYHASKAAGMDLTDFFERWGFFRPANNVLYVNTYNASFRITLTESKINAVKAQIQALGLPKPPLAFEYITTRNMDMYRTPRPVVAGTAARSGQVFTFASWQNVVAWEVIDDQGRLLYTTTGWRNGLPAGSYTFSLPDSQPWQSTYQVRAIAADGRRTVVSEV